MPPGSPTKEAFFRYFQAEVIALQDLMTHLPSVSPVERPAAIDDVLAGIARLSSEAKDASSYIPAYDQRTYGDAIKGLSEKLQSVREEMGDGKKKFKFKMGGKKSVAGGDKVEGVQERSRLGPRGGAWSEVAPMLRTGEDKMEQDPASKETVQGYKPESDVENSGAAVDGLGVMVSDHDGSHFVLPTSTAHSGSSATVSNVKKSFIDLSASTTGGSPFATLILKNIQNSLVMCGRISGPTHITGLENSVLVTNCRQFRMHGSKNVDVYLYCSSRPIIEDCQSIRFAPLPQQFVRHGIDNSTVDSNIGNR